MRRREFIALLGTFALPWMRTARAEPSRKIAKVGVLWHAGTAEEELVRPASTDRNFL